MPILTHGMTPPQIYATMRVRHYLSAREMGSDALEVHHCGTTTGDELPANELQRFLHPVLLGLERCGLVRLATEEEWAARAALFPSNDGTRAFTPGLCHWLPTDLT